MYMEKILIYMTAMEVFLDAYKKGLLSEITILKIEKILYKKVGLNSLSVFRYSKRDFDEILKKEIDKRELDRF